MAFCNVKNPPEYTAEIRKWDRETRADGQGMAVEIEQLFNNTYYNKETKVNKNGGDISETNIKTLDSIPEKFPVPKAEEKAKTFLGKVKKSMEDWKTFKNGIVTLGMLSNQYINSTDKIPTSALVYALKQTADQLNTKLDNLTEEKLLWSGSASAGDTITLSEPFTNFSELVFMFNSGSNVVWNVASSSEYITLLAPFITSANDLLIGAVKITGITNNKVLPVVSSRSVVINMTTGAVTPNENVAILRIYGKRRK